MIDIRETLQLKTLLSIAKRIVKRDTLVDFREELKNSGYNFDETILDFNLLRSAFSFILDGGVKREIKRVFMPGFICPVMAEVVKRSNKELVLVDSDLQTFNMDFDFVTKFGVGKNDAILINHTFGNPVSIKTLLKIPQNNRPLIISDNALALFSEIDGGYAGVGADLIMLNLHKQFANTDGALVIGNELLKNDYDVIKKDSGIYKNFTDVVLKTGGIHQNLINLIRSIMPLYKEVSAKISRWSVKRMSKFGGLVFRESLGNLKNEIEKRRELAILYDKLLPLKYFVPQKIEEGHSFANYAVRLKPEYKALRDRMVADLRSEGIFVDRMWYNSPTGKDYKKFIPQTLNNTKILAKTVINLPIRGDYSKQDVKYLFRAIDKILKNYSCE
ncbi:DegT/DnrJ/EryC1/StrS family aminotransferase [Patescibacteria group bacterium]|nr:DegT/DnrJ/EryC1/StrS family aminotransferase [Patescibacteria group bacterium]